MRIRRIGFACLIIDINNISPFPLQTPSHPIAVASAINRLATSGNGERERAEIERYGRVSRLLDTS